MSVMPYARLPTVGRKALVLSVALLAACSQSRTPPPDVAVPVNASSAVKKAVPELITAVGTAEPINSVAVKSRVDGQLLHALVKDGDAVKAGQLLFRIDPRSFQAQIEQVRAAQAKDEVQLAQARSEEKRYQELVKRGLVSKEQYQQMATARDVAQAMLKLDAANLASAQLLLDYSQIRAPISGRIGRVLVQPGNLVKANDTQALTVLNQITPIYINFSIPGKTVDRVRTAQDSNPLAVRVLGADKNKAIDGKISFIDNAVDVSTGTVKLRALLPNEDEQIWPGQFVNVSLILGQDQDSVVVPELAVKAGPNGNYVFVVGPDSRAQQRDVTVARTVAGDAVIDRGIVAGEMVVTDGQSRLSPGVRVAVNGAKR